MNPTTADPVTFSFTAPEDFAPVLLPHPEPAPRQGLPRWLSVLREQVGAVGLGLRREGMVAGALAGLATAAVLWMQMQNGLAHVSVSPEAGVAGAVMALLLSMSVWKNEAPGRRGYHHSMPVGQGAHAVAKATAGLAWALGGVVAFFVWVGTLAAFSGGTISAREPWQWLAPFASATVFYLLGSALALKASHPWRWLGGGAVGYLFLSVVRAADNSQPLTDLLDQVMIGRWGLRTLLTGLIDRRTMIPGEWGLIADFGSWVVATWLWLAIAVAAFVWAAFRQPEG